MSESGNYSIPDAIIMVIGDEILNGKTLDTNSRFLAQKLHKRGINIARRITIPDDLDIIVEEVRINSAKYDFLFASGGIGSTPDDRTRQAFADAFNLPLVRHTEAERIMREFQGDRLNEIRLRMADLPSGCDLIPNPFFGSPGFIIKNCFVFPGIPELLMRMFSGIEHLLPEIPLFVLSIKINHFEGEFTDIMQEIQLKYPEVKIGSYPAFKNPEYKVELTFEGYDEKKVHKVVDEFTSALKKLEDSG